MQKLIEEAKRLANRSESRLSTLHLLLVLFQQRGPSGNLLARHGVTESKLLSALRAGTREAENTLSRVQSKARTFANAVSVAEPSEMHLFTAVLSVPNTAGYRALAASGVNVALMKSHALRWVTGTGNPYTEETQRSLPLGQDYAMALPLPGGLGGFKVGRRGTGSPHGREPKHRRRAPDKPIRASMLHGMMGSEIEAKQRNRHLAQMKTERFSSGPKEASVNAAEPVSLRAALLSPERFPLLSTLGRNLNLEALEGRIEAIIGREREMEQITDVLNKRRANCPIVIGPAGVGKTALVEGLALKLTTGELLGLDQAVIVEIRPSDLLSGTSVRGALAERIDRMQKEVQEADGQVILFFDEIHALLASNDGAEAVRSLKSALGKGRFPCIAATSDDDYIKYVESDPALARRFTKVELAAPSPSEAVDILNGIIPAYRDHHRVAFDPEAVAAAVKLSERYLADRALPDKAISVLDTAGAKVRRRGAERVTADDVAQVIAEQLAIPKERLTTGDHERLLNLEAHLSTEIVGHDHVLRALGETLRRNAAGFRSGRPIGTFLFLGPTGVGKTETAKSLGDFLFPTKGAFIRLDMSEFAEAHAVARLVGAPPGYVGHEEGGQLTEAVRRRPYSLVLLDEIEKAHPEVLQVLLQVLDDGRLTDGMGRTVVFENTIIVMTSNLGCALRQEKRRVGFGAKRSVEELPSIKDAVLGTVRETLPPELWNRLDELLVFEPLTRPDVLEIAERMIQRVDRQLSSEKQIRLGIGDGLLETLADAGGFDPEFGARPMRRTIQRLVEGPVARLVLEGQAVCGDAIIAYGTDGDITFEIVENAAEEAVTAPAVFG